MSAKLPTFDRERFVSGFPEVELAPRLPPDRAPRLLSAMPGVPLRRALSGSTWRLATAGIKAGQLEGAFSRYPVKSAHPIATLYGGFWKLSRTLSRQKSGGYKFSPLLSDMLWSGVCDRLSGAHVMNTFQLSGRELLNAAEKGQIELSYYIDGTLAEYFETYDAFDTASIGHATRKRAIAAEREGYQAASHLFVMSRACKRALIERYGVPGERIVVAPPGANMSEEMTALAAETAPRACSGPFTIGFIGLYPERKGLDRLGKAVEIALSRGVEMRLIVIGRSIETLQGKPWVEDHGIIDKQREPQRFVEAVSRMDLGCQLSYAELAGVALCEYLRMGIPILGTDVGGAIDLLEGGGGVIVPADVEAEALAETLIRLAEDPDGYAALKAQAQARQSWADWSRAAAQMDKALSGVG